VSLVLATAWVWVRDRRVLVVRPGYTDAFYLPGGKPEPGETYAEAAAREVREEVGLLVDPAELTLFTEIVAPAHNRPPGTSVRLICFTGGTPAPAAASPSAPSPAFVVARSSVAPSGADPSVPSPATPAEPVVSGEIGELGWFTSLDADRCAPAIRLLLDELVAADLID